MEAAKQLTALKKAYADIMLNNAKEAAARVMESERKAAWYQHELKVTKEEALRMLLRLKQMMDFKISEAEAASLNQQKKMEELEAQLQETEDIVNNLREELRLEQLKNKKMQVVEEPDNACLRDVPKENNFYSSQSITCAAQNLQNESSISMGARTQHPPRMHDVFKKTIPTNNSFSVIPELPSIILRNKKPRPYRKGCTQRIRACERDLLDKEPYHAGKHDKSTRIGECEDTFVEPAQGANTLSDLETNLLNDVKLSSSKSFVSKRKRAMRQRKSVTLLGREKYDRLLQPTQAFKANSGENPSMMVPNLFPDKPQPGIELDCAESFGKEAVLAECCDVQDGMSQDQALIETLLLLRQGTEPAASSGTSDCKVDDEKLLVNNLQSTLSENTTGHPDQARRERFFKYTFQRKRKRQPSSENVDIETDTSDGNSETEQNGEEDNGDEDLDNQKLSLIARSFKDDLPLAQVARQLIPLSQKKGRP